MGLPISLLTPTLSRGCVTRSIWSERILGIWLLYVIVALALVACCWGCDCIDGAQVGCLLNLSVTCVAVVGILCLLSIPLLVVLALALLGCDTVNYQDYIIDLWQRTNDKLSLAWEFAS